MDRNGEDDGVSLTIDAAGIGWGHALDARDAWSVRLLGADAAPGARLRGARGVSGARSVHPEHDLVLRRRRCRLREVGGVSSSRGVHRERDALHRRARRGLRTGRGHAPRGPRRVDAHARRRTVRASAERCGAGACGLHRHLGVSRPRPVPDGPRHLQGDALRALRGVARLRALGSVHAERRGVHRDLAAGLRAGEPDPRLRGAVWALLRSARAARRSCLTAVHCTGRRGRA